MLLNSKLFFSLIEYLQETSNILIENMILHLHNFLKIIFDSYCLTDYHLILT